MEVDLIILGGGCAGLSLALELARLKDSCPNTVILESRNVYSNDRTWGYWSDGADRLSLLTAKRFSRMRVGGEGAESLYLNCGKHPYSILPSMRFYENALAEIKRQAKIKLMLGSTVLGDPAKKESQWIVKTAVATYSAKNIVDTRPSPQSSSLGGGLWQSFLGMEIETDQENFNPECMDLMDFENHSRFPIFFTYLIPSSKYRALIEVTVFSPQAHARQDLEEDLQRIIHTRVGNAHFAVLREECGVLPMGMRSQITSGDSSYARVGLHFGAARPSSGYAFQRIQRWAEACANHLKNRGRPLEHSPDPGIIRMMDTVFISVLRSHPKRAPDLFVRLFEKVSTPRLIRFLSGTATWLDCACIILALPALLFLKELPRVVQVRHE